MLEPPKIFVESQEDHRPIDQSTGMDHASLVELVLKIALSVGEDELVPITASEGGGALPPRSLLALLVYCYSLGIFSSHDIEEHLHEDAEFHSLCGNEQPDSTGLQRFRRLNRCAVQHCLEESLGWASQCQIGREREDMPPWCGQRVPVPTGRIEPDLRLHVAREAKSRLDRAVRLDSMAADE